MHRSILVHLNYLNCEGQSIYCAFGLQVSVWGYKVGDMVSVDGTTNKAVVQSFNAELVCIKYLDGGYVWVAAESLHLVTET